MNEIDPLKLDRILNKIDKARVDGDNELAQAVNRVDAQQALAQQQQQMESIKEIVTHSYGRAAAYNNLIMVAGYAVFFAMWKSVKDEFSRTVILASGILVITSALLFVIAQVHAMFTRTMFFRDMFKKFAKKPSPSFVQDVQSAEQEFARKMFRSWLILFIPTLVTGLVGAVLLLGCFLQGLVCELAK